MRRLLQIAADYGLTVIEEHGEHLGGYRPGDTTIRLTPGMPRRVARSVLAHELGHHALGHLPTAFGPLRARHERAANQWAAQLLIDRDRYREVEELRSGHSPSMAFDLDVAVELVDAYKSMLLRLGDTVYMKPGLADFADRVQVA